MPSLSDKLKSMGVKVGAQNLPPKPSRPSPGHPFGIEHVVAGRALANHQGETYVVDSSYPAGYLHGRVGLMYTAPLQAMAAWCSEPRLCECTPQSFAFIDTETTGLAGGTGTYAFLIGAGRFEGQEFHLAQFFMRDPAEEPAQLAALEEFLAPCTAIVTFNGKTFDVPLLNTRFTYHGWRTPFLDTAHVDLLHLARRLWRDRLPSRTLGNLEIQILGASRTEEDVPGYMIPEMYFQYLRDGDAQPLKSVFYHNAVDVISMAALFNHMSALLADPFNGRVEHGVDLIALAKLFEGVGDLETATRLYIHGLEHEDVQHSRLPKNVLLDALSRLATIYKHQENWAAALALWEQAARHGHLEAHVELAKYYEHRAKDYRRASDWTAAAITTVKTPQPGASRAETLLLRRQWLPDLEHRLARLARKAAANSDQESDLTANNDQDES